MRASDVSTMPMRAPAVAGSFYPADPPMLRRLVADLLRVAGGDEHPAIGRAPCGILVPHAGLEYSGAVAAAGWRQMATVDRDSADTDADANANANANAPTIVILGTNHSARLDGIGIWDAGAWWTPLGEVIVDADVARAIAALGYPFHVDRPAHLREHSIEVQLPLLHTVAPGTRIVPLAVSAGTGEPAIAAGHRLGTLLRELRLAGRDVHLAISSDLAHYPADDDCARATALLAPAIVDVDPGEVAARERTLVRAGIAGLVCGMCGIEPTVLGLAALRAMGAIGGTVLAEATSADAGGPGDRTVGYLAVEFRAPEDGAGSAV